VQAHLHDEILRSSRDPCTFAARAPNSLDRRTGSGLSSLRPGRCHVGSGRGYRGGSARRAGLSPRPRAATAAPQYRLTIVGSAGTELFGINKNGAVFGIAVEKGAKVQEGFPRRVGTTKLLPLGRPGDLANANSSSAPEAINGSADAVGSATSFATGNATAAEWPESATPTDLGTSPGSGTRSTPPAATSINDNGLITVFGSHGHGDAGFTIQGSTVTRLPALPNGSVDVQPLAPDRRKGRHHDDESGSRGVVERRNQRARRAARQFHFGGSCGQRCW